MASPLDPLTKEMLKYEARKKNDRRRDVHELSKAERLQMECRGRAWWLRVPFAIALVWSFFSYIVNPGELLLIDWVSIALHRTGHVIWETAAGDYTPFLGGILFQLLVPLAVIETCRRKTTPFYVAIACGWLSANVLWLSTYAEGAAQEIFPPGLKNELVHDWQYMLEILRRLDLADETSLLLYGIGMITMGICLYIVAYQLYFMFRLEERRISSRRAVRAKSARGVEDFEVKTWHE